jgi:hypothetical protein
MMTEENPLRMQVWTPLPPVAYPLLVQPHPQQYEIATSDLDNMIYVQIMEACHPFYQFSEKVESATFKIPPRLEDGLGITSQTSSREGNPQDGASL